MVTKAVFYLSSSTHVNKSVAVHSHLNIDPGLWSCRDGVQLSTTCAQPYGIPPLLSAELELDAAILTTTLGIALIY